jgi:hypothetical protein
MLKSFFAGLPGGISDRIDLHQMDVTLTREMSAALARAGVATFRQALPRLRAELDRARRYNRPITVALLGDARVSPALSPAAVAHEADSRRRSVSTHSSPLGPGSPLLPAVIASLLREMTREVDIVTYAATLGRCLIAMPEATEAEGRQAMARVGEMCARQLMVPVYARLAIFPKDGWTLEELVRRAVDNDPDTHSAPEPAPAWIRVGEVGL